MTSEKTKSKDFRNAVLTKYRENREHGAQKTLAGNVAEFKSYEPEQTETGISLYCFLNEESKIRLDSLVSKIEELAHQYQIPLDYTSSLWRPHIQVGNLKFRSGQSDTQETAFEMFRTQMKPVLQELIGLPIVFNSLIPGNVITLTATNFPDSIIQARIKISQLGNELQMEEKDYRHILHISLGRFGGKMTQVNEADREKFLEELHQLDSELLFNPLLLTIGEVEVMSNKDFMLTHERPMFEKMRRNLKGKPKDNF